MDELNNLHEDLKDFIDEIEEKYGSERVQPYIVILKGIAEGIKTDIISE
jgi:hypothetical protein